MDPRGVGAHLNQGTMRHMTSYEMPGTTNFTRAEGETLTHLLSSIVALSRRWTSAGIKGKGIHLADHELDLLNAIGAGDILLSAAAAEQKKQAVERRAHREVMKPVGRVTADVPATAVKRARPASNSHSKSAAAETRGQHVNPLSPLEVRLDAVNHRGDNLLRISEVCRRTGLSVATIYRRGDERTFPSKVRLGPKSVAWYESDIEKFVADPSGYRASALPSAQA